MKWRIKRNFYFEPQIVPADAKQRAWIELSNPGRIWQAKVKISSPNSSESKIIVPDFLEADNANVWIRANKFGKPAYKEKL